MQIAREVFHARMTSMLHAQGTFFLLEKLKLTVLRRLLMRCCILHLEASAADPNPHHFPLGKHLLNLTF